MEMSIDEECARILARRQPAAGDLRLVLAISKVNTDLERVGDEAGKIARQAIQLSEDGAASRGYVEVRHIGERVIDMLHRALDSFARLDAVQALEVAREDKFVDREYNSAIRELVTYMMEDSRQITRTLNVIWALRSLERIGDHARNIAEYVIYLVKGKDVRHIGLTAMAAKVHET
jgi:phosphate transport system protein